tara:strand:+ start:69 stop:1349 length:1281 start_codon:yes stop_codon:yes gene_type:complete
MKRVEGIFKKNSKGVFAISLVNSPATEETFIAMSKQEETVQFSSVDKEQRILMGLVLQPGQLIPRVDNNGNEFEMFFSANTIKEFSQNFFKSGYQLNSKLEHDTAIEGVAVVESWIIENSAIDKSANFGMSFPKGSWMVSMKVDNDEIWNNYIKNGKLLGFSIDAMVDLKEVNLKSNINMSKTSKGILAKLKEIVAGAETEVTFGSVKSGELDIQFEGDALEVGSAVWTMAEEEKVSLPDGEYPIDDAEGIVVADGAVESFVPVQEEEEEEVTEEPTEEPQEEVKEVEDTDEAVEEEVPTEEAPEAVEEVEEIEEEVKEETEETEEEETEEVETPSQEDDSFTKEDVAMMIDAMLEQKLADMGLVMSTMKEEFNTELSALKVENETLKSEVVTLSEQPVGNAIASTPRQVASSSVQRILDGLAAKK